MAALTRDANLVCTLCGLFAASNARCSNKLMFSAGLIPSDIVMDLFCGTGSIGLTLAKDCRHVYGFEVSASSVADARRNAEVNGISNATFVHGDLTQVAATMGKKYPGPDVIVTGALRLFSCLCQLPCMFTSPDQWHTSPAAAGLPCLPYCMHLW